MVGWTVMSNEEKLEWVRIVSFLTGVLDLIETDVPLAGEGLASVINHITNTHISGAK